MKKWLLAFMYQIGFTLRQGWDAGGIHVKKDTPSK